VPKRRLAAVTHRKFSVLLTSLLLVLLLNPFFGETVVGRIISNASVSAVALSAIYAVSGRKRVFTVALLLLLAILAARWSGHFLQNNALTLMADGLAIPFLVVTAGIVLSYVMRGEEVTADKISGAVCVYLLIGVTWGLLFSAIERLQPGSFQPGSAVDATSTGERLPLFVYFSFVTLTTVGYGDVLPLSPLARSLAVVEAVLGQIYLATLIARLVGLHIVHSLKKGSR